MNSPESSSSPVRPPSSSEDNVTPADESLSSNAEAPSRSVGLESYLPLILLSIGFLLLLMYQMSMVSQRNEQLQAQLDALKARDQNIVLFRAQLENLVADLRHLAKTDPDAQAIIRKHVRVQGPAPASIPAPGVTAPSPASETVPVGN